MKRTQIPTQIGSLVLSHINRAIALVATSGLMTLVACSSSPRTGGNTSSSNSNGVPVAQPVATAQPVAPQIAKLTNVSAKASSSPVQHTIHREPLSTFRDSDFGVSIEYPWQYGFKGGHKLRSQGEEVMTGFVGAGGVNLATIDVPAGYYQNTDFARAYLSMNVNRKLTSEQCSQFAGSESGSDKLVPLTTKVGDQEYAMVEQKSDNSTLRAYHTYQGGACYGFILGLNTRDSDSGDANNAQQIKPVSQKLVFARLENIMATVQFEPDQDGAAVAGAPVASSATGDTPPQQKP
jgi:hypothetical protein